MYFKSKILGIGEFSKLSSYNEYKSGSGMPEPLLFWMLSLDGRAFS